MATSNSLPAVQRPKTGPEVNDADGEDILNDSKLGTDEIADSLNVEDGIEVEGLGEDGELHGRSVRHKTKL